MSTKGLEYVQGPTRFWFNKLGALALLAPFSPAMVGGAALSVIDTRQTPLFSQDRPGRDGDLFKILKLRTLRNVPTASHLITETYGTNDPRASKLGMFLRRTGIDEMPQLFNVLAGDLDLFGIRSLLEYDHERMEKIDSGLYKDFVLASQQVPGWTGVDSFFRKIQPCCTDDVYRRSMHLGIGYRDNATLRGDMRMLGYAARVMFGVGAECAVGNLIGQYVEHADILQEFHSTHPNLFDLPLSTDRSSA